MRRRFASSLAALVIFSAACAPLPVQVPPSPSPTATSIVPWIVTLAAPATDTPIPQPFFLDLTPQPSPTALATLVLPPSPSVPLDPLVWDGLPTYPAESLPDFYFRLRYDAAAWALTSDQFGFPVLASRRVTGCLIGTSSGRGLPLTARVDHDVRIVGDITYQISRASIDGALQFVSYAGGDGRIFTAFFVAFEEPPDECLPSAELVLGTLRSVPASEATPVSQ